MSLPQQNGFNPKAPAPPNVAYPGNGVRTQPSHTHNSYGPVFIILAVILGISLLACLVGRLCSRKSSSQGRAGHRQGHFGGRPKERDLENGHRRGSGPPRDHANHINGEYPEFNYNGGDGQIRGEIKPGQLHEDARFGPAE